MSEGEFTDHEELKGILLSYRRKQLYESLCGPGFSFFIHVIILALMFMFLVKQEQPPVEEKMTVKMLKVEKKVIPPVEPDPVKKVINEEPDPIEEPVTVDTNDLENPAKKKTETELESVQDAPDVSVPQPFVNMPQTPITISVSGGPPIGRDEKDRGRAFETAHPRVQTAIGKALGWLASVQNNDGSWGNQSPAHTGLALLTFLGYGESIDSPRYGQNVMYAIKWLCNAVDEKGNLGQKAYGHGIATYALAEAYGMTMLPPVKKSLEKALQYIIDGQQANGGFNYNYSKGERWDGSVSGWQFQALKTAYLVGAKNAGLQEALQKAISFNRNISYKNHKFGYTKAGSGGNMTGIGLVSLQVLTGENSHLVTETVKHTMLNERLDTYMSVLKYPDKWGKVAAKNMYGWYYDTQALFNTGGNSWKKWQRVFERVLIKNQNTAGYWQTDKGHGLGESLDGRILATCWSTLQLEVYFRTLTLSDIKVKDAGPEMSISIEDAI